jgi:hypothetical protein
MKVRKDKVKYGLTFKWNKEFQSWQNRRSKKRQIVRVAPPAFRGDSWTVFIPATVRSYNFAGKDVINRAFSTAEVFSRQE